MSDIELVLRGEHIALDTLLKATGLAPSGGTAKRIIESGEVRVDGRHDTRRSHKIRAGQVVAWRGAVVRVRAAATLTGRSEEGSDRPPGLGSASGDESAGEAPFHPFEDGDGHQEAQADR